VGLEHAQEFPKDTEAVGNVTHGVIGIDGVKGGVRKRELGGRIVQKKGNAGLQRFGKRQGVGALDALRIDIETSYSAADGFGEVQRAASVHSQFRERRSFL